jgi:molybdopterin-containing oxidoreductase family iron-sulfur binding subunit
MEYTNDKKYWRGLEELYQEPEFVESAQKEFDRDIPVDELLEQAASSALTSNRREFLKYLGFSIGAATLAACTSTPVKYALPYVVKPNEIIPGVANYYSSTFWDGLEYVAIRVKTREGRPIKIEGNPDSPVSMGGTSARSQASVLSLYDNFRLKGPQKDGKPAQWDDVDNAIKAALANGGVYLVTSSIISPSTQNLINQFAEKYKAKVVTYDPISYSGILEANQKCFGKKEIPQYYFDKCEVVVGFNADFLGTWLSPTGNIRRYADAKRLLDKKDMLMHIQFETNMTLTGANADKRIPMKPSQEGAAILALYNAIASQLGKPTLNGDGVKLAGNYIDIAASKLVAAKGKSIVVSGSNNPSIQILVNGINAMLGNYGSTIDLDNSTNYFQGIDSEFENFIADLEAGKVKTVLFANVNPVYNYFNATKLEGLLKNVETRVSFSQVKDETASLCNYILPDSHYLESWSDARPTKNVLGLQQPTINKLFDTRQFQDSLLKWLDDKRTFYQYIKDFWKENFYSKEKGNFEDFWIESLQSGYAALKTLESKAYEVKTEVLQSAAAAINQIKSTGTEVQLYVKVGIGDGSAANNPWLQELPDPITKVCWDNYVTIGKPFADKLGLKTNDVVNVVAGNVKIKLPVWVQPGQTNETIGIALGYGRKSAGKAGTNVGANAYALVSWFNGNRIYYNTVSIEKNR